MFMNFSINKTLIDYTTITIHSCVSGKNCTIIEEMSRIRYLSIIFENNLR